MPKNGPSHRTRSKDIWLSCSERHSPAANPSWCFASSRTRCFASLPATPPLVRQNKDHRCDRRVRHSAPPLGSRATPYSWHSPLERVATPRAVQCSLQQLGLTTTNPFCPKLHICLLFSSKGNLKMPTTI